jgi:hypothetical protein
VGGKDLIRQRENGSVVPVDDATALASELMWWAEHPHRPGESFGWSKPAEKLIEHSSRALS